MHHDVIAECLTSLTWLSSTNVWLEEEDFSLYILMRTSPHHYIYLLAFGFAFFYLGQLIYTYFYCGDMRYAICDLIFSCFLKRRDRETLKICSSWDYNVARCGIMESTDGEWLCSIERTCMVLGALGHGFSTWPWMGVGWFEHMVPWTVRQLGAMAGQATNKKSFDLSVNGSDLIIWMMRGFWFVMLIWY
jgi:hypothetical protein